MDSVLDLFMGDPVYDDQNNVIRRDFGVKNIVALMVVGFIGYSLMGEIKPKSGMVMKGGDRWAVVRVLGGILVVVVWGIMSYFVADIPRLMGWLRVSRDDLIMYHSISTPIAATIIAAVIMMVSPAPGK